MYTTSARVRWVFHLSLGHWLTTCFGNKINAVRFCGERPNSDVLMLWRVHQWTVNPLPQGKQSLFDSKDIHQILDSKYNWYMRSPVKRQTLGSSPKLSATL